MRRRTLTTDLPEFPEDVQWLNVERPLRLRELQGKVVVLNFFTACCIHCAHVIEDLRRLHARYEPDLVVIGVHSPRLAAEREDGAVRDALLQHRIDYAVIDDRDMRVWKSFNVRAWPTTVLIGPEGRVLQRRVGEAIFETLNEPIATTLRNAARSGGVNHEPLPLRPERPASAGADAPPLSFPGSILADGASERLFISDTGNNRVIIAGFDGVVLDVAGRRQVGLEDGSFERAEFHAPQGLALDGTALYVADRANHAIRRLDLRDRTVERIAGTGVQEPATMRPGPALKTSLNSPWGLELVHHRLYITMAGAHQIWRFDLPARELEPYAGGSTMGLLDETRFDCLLTQPTGLTSDGVRLFFVDAGTSALRWVYLPPGKQLGTWIGQGLFRYGDVDGDAGEALLQHPMGVAHHEGLIYVADTHNHKIKVFNPRPARIHTLLGTGERGLRDGDPGALNAPQDLSCAGGRIWIADTNNHAIRVAPLSGGPMTTLDLHPQERLERAGA